MLAYLYSHEYFEVLTLIGCICFEQGTLFRLALRTECQAQSSKLSSRAQRPDHVAEMLREFSGDLSRIMLFLRNITKIAIYEWREGSGSPRLLDEAMISNLTPDIQAKRSLSFASFGSNNAQLMFSTNGKRMNLTLV